MQTNNQTYYAHGKLLLTAEYFVLRGAKAIALPLKYGQHMVVASGTKKGILDWNAFSPDGLWFACELTLPGFEIVSTTDEAKAVVLQRIFQTIQQLKLGFEIPFSLDVQTRTTFNKEWGMGSSSTLIANLASWAKVDAFKLNDLIFNGSGFDMACANANSLILYTKGQAAEAVSLNFPFKDQLYFVYSGKKKATQNEVIRFLTNEEITSEDIGRIDRLTDQFASAATLNEFQQLMTEHENMVSELLGVPTIKSTDFSDFPGEIKSLGAWGGDFYLAASNQSESDVRKYFQRKNLSVVFGWDELVKEKDVISY